MITPGASDQQAAHKECGYPEAAVWKGPSGKKREGEKTDRQTHTHIRTHTNAKSQL